MRNPVVLPERVEGCGVLAAGRILSAGRVLGEFKRAEEARPGDVLLFMRWAERRVCFGVALGGGLVALCLEAERGRVGARRLATILRRGYEFAGGIRLG